MSDIRPGPLEVTLKVATRVRTRGVAEVWRLGLERIRDGLSSEDRLIMLVRDARGAGARAAPEGLTLRAATPDDGPRYARWVGTDSPATFRRRLSERTRCYLVAEGDKLVHASWVTLAAAWTRELRTYLCPPKGDAYVYESFTRADARGRGVYPFTLEGICSQLADEGVGQVWVAVEADNAASLKAVGKAGFSTAFELSYRRRWARLSVGPATGPRAEAGDTFIGCGEDGAPGTRRAAT